MNININTFIGTGGTLENALNEALLNMSTYIAKKNVQYISHSHSHSHVVEERESEDVDHFYVSIILVFRSFN